MHLAELTDPELIFPDISGIDGDAILRELADRLAAAGRVRKPGKLFELLRERESLGSTALGQGVAVPHCRIQGVSGVLVAVGLCREGVDFAAEDGEPVRLFFVVVSSNSAPAEHLHCLAAISKWVKNGRLCQLMDFDEPQEIYDWIGETTGEDD